MTLILYGYKYSVYLRIVRLTLAEKGLRATHAEINPFEAQSEEQSNIHPFGRVPVLEHAGFRLYETTTITRYLDEAFPGPALQPLDPKARARMAQIIAIIDNYAYQPLIRQVFSHAVFRPAFGKESNPEMVAEGMATAPQVMGALEQIAAEGLVLGSETPTNLAALHLAPMLDYFLKAPGAGDLLAKAPTLNQWWETFKNQASLTTTDPGLSLPPLTD